MSMENVWWKCPLNHSWRGTIGNRVKKMFNVLFVTIEKFLPGFNDLQNKKSPNGKRME